MTTRTTGRRSPSPRAIVSDRRRRGLRLGAALLTTALCPLPALAQELPTGGTVVSGGAAIATPGAGRMQVTQTTPRAIVEWNGFGVGAGGAVDFAQPGADSAVLNRVTGPLGSRIDGTLTGNGQVILVNPHGVVVSPSGRVETGSFVASTLDIDNADFEAGQLRFSGTGASAPVANHGTISVARGGFAALLGGKVTNTGTITAPMGRIGLGAGERATLDLTGDGFLQIALPSETDEEVLIEQAGRVSADGGRVEISAATAREAARRVVNLSGVTEARSVSGRSGAIVLGGGPGGTVRVTGRVDAGAAPSRVLVEASPRPAVRPQGGEIRVTGERIELALGAEIWADGPGGGGRVRIGGDIQGQGPLPRARSLTMEAGAVVGADATEAGDGGTIVLWADTEASVFGLLTARGGPAGGDGGFVEASSPGALRFAGSVDTSAPLGAGGTFLLDPTDVLVCDFAPGSCEAGVTPGVYTTEQIETLLATTAVTVKTAGLDEINVIPFDLDLGSDAGDITVAGDIEWSSSFTLILDAARDISLLSTISMLGTETPAIDMFSGRDIVIDGDIRSPGSGRVFADAAGDVILNGNIEGPDTSFFAGRQIETTGDIVAAIPGNDQAVLLAAGFLDPAGRIRLDGDVLAPSGRLALEAPGGISATGAVDVGVFSLDLGTWTQLGPLPAFAADDFRLRTGEASFLRATGGTGSAADPYVIVDAYGLQGAGWGEFSTESFALGADIDASGSAGWNDFGSVVLGWRPIGALGSIEDFTSEAVPYFSGSLDGRGFTVSGLTIREPGLDARDQSLDPVVGMFGGLEGATITNLTLTGVDFATAPVAFGGGLAARAIGPTALSGVAVSGGLSFDGSLASFTQSLFAGGLLGELAAGGTLSASSFSGALSLVDVAPPPPTPSPGGGGGEQPLPLFPGGGSPHRAAENYAEIGGAVGLNLGTLEGVSTEVALSVTGGAEAPDLAPVAAGGLVGANEGALGASSAAGSIAVSGNPRGGGPQPGGEAWFDDEVGGAVGFNPSGGTITGVTATTDVTLSSGSNAVAGGLVGRNAGSVAASRGLGAVAYSGDAPFHEGSAFGGFVGENTGDIVDARAEGAVSFSGPAFDIDEDGVNFATLGGFAGSNTGRIARSAATGAVSADGGSIAGFDLVAGGHTGLNLGTVSNSYARGTVALSDATGGAAGGFVGRDVSNTTVADSYSTGAVSATGGSALVGGFAGEVLGGGISGAYWDIETSGLTASAGGTGLTTAELQDTEAFPSLAGWDFATTWAPGTTGEAGGDGGGKARYPRLYTIDPVVYAIVGDFPGGVAFGDTEADATGTRAGGPGTYVFGPVGETLPDPAIFGALTLPALPAGQTPGVTFPTRQVTGSAGTVFHVVYAPTAVEVTARPLTVIASDQFKVYGDPGFALDQIAFAVEGELLPGDVLTVTLSSDGAAVTAPAGTSAILVDAALSGPEAANYALAVEEGTLQVSRAPLAITPDDLTKTEGVTLSFAGTEFTAQGLRNDDAVTRVGLESPGAAAGAVVAGSAFPIGVIPGSEQGRGLSNYDIAYGTGALAVVAPPGPPDPEPSPEPSPVRPPFAVAPPPNPADAELPEILTPAAQRGGGGGAFAFGTGSARSVTGSLEVAETTLAVLTRASDELALAAAACRQDEDQVTDFLGCIAEALERYGAALDPSVLELPEAMEAVSASIEVARQGIDGARRRAEQRLAGVTDPARRREIESAALGEARAALQTAEAEVTKAITLIRADDPDLANAYRAQARTVLAAIDAVDLELQRAVGL